MKSHIHIIVDKKDKVRGYYCSADYSCSAEFVYEKEEEALANLFISQLIRMGIDSHRIQVFTV